jgi:hypothetical protein
MAASKTKRRARGSRTPRTSKAGAKRTGYPHAITKRGKTVAAKAPSEAKKRGLLGIFKGRMEILGDIISPIDVEWEALK